jgi:Ankyrin repeats (3 copies)
MFAYPHKDKIHVIFSIRNSLEVMNTFTRVLVTTSVITSFASAGRLRGGSQKAPIQIVDPVVVDSPPPSSRSSPALPSNFPPPQHAHHDEGHPSLVELQGNSSSQPPYPLPHRIAGAGDLLGVQAALEQEPNWVQARDVHGWTMLHEAARGGHMEVCRFLMEQGADVNAETNEGSTPLYEALVFHGNEAPIVQYLEEIGAVLKAPKLPELPELKQELSVDEIVHSRLPHIMASEGRLDDLKELVQKHGGDLLLQTADENGWTPLHEATRTEQLHVIRFLVKDQHVHVNPTTPNGSTPLFLAQGMHGADSAVAELLRSLGGVSQGPGVAKVDHFI